MEKGPFYSFKTRRKIIQFYRKPFVQKVSKTLKKLILPGFQGVPFWDVMRFFLESLFRGILFRPRSSHDLLHICISNPHVDDPDCHHLIHGTIDSTQVARHYPIANTTLLVDHHHRFNSHSYFTTKQYNSLSFNRFGIVPLFFKCEFNHYHIEYQLF